MEKSNAQAVTMSTMVQFIPNSSGNPYSNLIFVCIVIITLLLAKVTEYVLLKSSSTLIGEIRYPILAPFATILICILLSPRTALFAATFLSIILSVSLAFDQSRFLVLNLVTSIVIIICYFPARCYHQPSILASKITLSSIKIDSYDPCYPILFPTDSILSNTWMIGGRILIVPTETNSCPTTCPGKTSAVARRGGQTLPGGRSRGWLGTGRLP